MRIMQVAISSAVLSISNPGTAAIVNADLRSAGDNLVTRDTVSGLDWLDLTETNNMSRVDVLAKLGDGGEFDGWRYAARYEVADLWLNFGIDFSGSDYGYYSGVVNPGIVQATSFLGNIPDDPAVHTYSLIGITGLRQSSTSHYILGAFYNAVDGYNVYHDIRDGYSLPDTGAAAWYGHYLVKDASVVPVPAAVWMFGSGLLGLIGMARRKRTG